MWSPIRFFFFMLAAVAKAHPLRCHRNRKSPRGGSRRAKTQTSVLLSQPSVKASADTGGGDRAGSPYSRRHNIPLAVESGIIGVKISSGHNVGPSKTQQQIWMNRVTIDASFQTRAILVESQWDTSGSLEAMLYIFFFP